MWYTVLVGRSQATGKDTTEMTKKTTAKAKKTTQPKAPKINGTVYYLETVNANDWTRTVDATAWLKRNTVWAAGTPDAPEKLERPSGDKTLYGARFHNADTYATGRHLTVWFWDKARRDAFMALAKTSDKAVGA